MLIYYKQNCKRQTLFLLSYLEEYGCVPFKTRAFDPTGTLDEIENSEDNYILFSNIMPRDLTLNIRIIERIKNKFSKLKINIVLGGTLFSILHNREALEHIPGITHICEGKGEEFIKELIENRLPPSPALYPKIVLDFNFTMLYMLWAWKHKIKSNGHCRNLNLSSIL